MAKSEQLYDLLVLGGGPGGYTAAFRAADLGLSVCLVEERDSLGGVCLNEGCIPSKTLLHGAALVEKAAGAADYGVNFGGVKIDVFTLLAKKKQVVEQLAAGLDKLGQLRKITRVRGRGYFQDDVTLLVTAEDGGESELRFTNCVIATGSSPFILPGIPDDPRIWDSGDALAITTIPENFLIIGGGIIGLEMARIYSALGSKITIVEMEAQIIPPADKDLVQLLFLQLKKKYQIFTKSRVTALKAAATGILASFEGPNAPEQAGFDAVLVAVGRRPNSADLGLENTGVEVSERGFIEVNEQCQSSCSHIYAVGDVAGEPMLAHKASHQARVAAENIAGGDARFCPATIPSVAYTDPEIAWMGMTEKEVRAQKIKYSKGKFPWGANGRALSSACSTGVTKVLFEQKSGVIIGAGICGAHAGELIHEAVLALEKNATARDIGRTVHAHPTLAETFACAAESVDGTIIDALPARKK